jgi:hypothetical protein
MNRPHPEAVLTQSAHSSITGWESKKNTLTARKNLDLRGRPGVLVKVPSFFIEGLSSLIWMAEKAGDLNRRPAFPLPLNHEYMR